MSELRIETLTAEIAGIEVLRGIDLVIRSGEVHAVMGPNGAGKSSLANVLMGHPSYTVSAGSVHLDGVDLLALSTFERALAGLYLAPQDPVEVPGVALASVLTESLAARGRPSDLAELTALVEREADELGISAALLARAINVDSSGGEKKRVETLQLAVLEPRIAILDELDSGLDVDALRQVARRIERDAHGLVNAAPGGAGALGVLAITHYTRLLTELRPDAVHVLVGGRIVDSGGPELAMTLEESGYAGYLAETASASSATDDLFSSP